MTCSFFFLGSEGGAVVKKPDKRREHSYYSSIRRTESSYNKSITFLIEIRLELCKLCKIVARSIYLIIKENMWKPF